MAGSVECSSEKRIGENVAACEKNRRNTFGRNIPASTRKAQNSGFLLIYAFFTLFLG